MAFLATIAFRTANGLPPLRVRGSDLVDPDGQAVILKGVNVGNWFVIEPWMLGLADGPSALSDQYEIESILSTRFGESAKDALIETYRKNWIQESDFGVIRSFGFNAIRLPLNYRQFEDDSRPYQLRKDAFIWTDRILKWATQNGIYVILDMHGVQGGQSVYDHTGRSGQNKLWTDVDNQKRLAWLWGEIAQKYRGNGTVAAYDVFNEPYGGTHELQKKIFSMSYDSIRKNDPSTMILAMGHTDTFTHYGTPTENGWTGVGYQMHYYPGMFGNGEPSLMNQAKHLRFLAGVQEEVKRFNAPFLVGEMNVVFDAAGGGAMMRKTYDLHASYGWHTTMWSYKVINKDGGHGSVSWGMVANENPVEDIDIRTAELKDIQSWFTNLGTMKLSINRGLFDAMIAKSAPVLELPVLPEPRRNAPHHQNLVGWSQTDIGGALAGGLSLGEGNSFSLFGGGADIWGGQDQFRFLHREVRDQFEIEVTVDGVEDVHGYTKAGLMIRSGLEENSAHVMLTTFPSGEVQFAWRPKVGETTDALPSSLKVNIVGARLKLVRKGNLITGFVKESGKEWVKVGDIELELPIKSLAGAIALSHEPSQLVKIDYRDLNIRE